VGYPDHPGWNRPVLAIHPTHPAPPDRKRPPGLENLRPGTPAILYFTTPECAPCKTIQRPALQRLQQQLGGQLQVIEINAAEKPDLAGAWGVLSVPTTFVLDPQGRPRHINHGVTNAEKLLHQLREVG
jgi:thiol-disulfide isomerase/thioredoxin